MTPDATVATVLLALLVNRSLGLSSRSLLCILAPSDLAQAIYLVLRYESDFTAGVTANAMLGGDSAARALLMGSWLGSVAGADALPHRLVEGLQAAEEVRGLVGELRDKACES